MRKIVWGAIVIMLMLTFVASAQESKPVPVVSDLQKVQFQNALLRIRVAQLEAEALFSSMQVPGYVLDQQTLTYTKIPDKK
jgi:hypothetical protein